MVPNSLLRNIDEAQFHTVTESVYTFTCDSAQNMLTVNSSAADNLELSNYRDANQPVKGKIC